MTIFGYANCAFAVVVAELLFSFCFERFVTIFVTISMQIM